MITRPARALLQPASHKQPVKLQYLPLRYIAELANSSPLLQKFKTIHVTSSPRLRQSIAPHLDSSRAERQELVRLPLLHSDRLPQVSQRELPALNQVVERTAHPHQQNLYRFVHRRCFPVARHPPVLPVLLLNQHTRREVRLLARVEEPNFHASTSVRRRPFVAVIDQLYNCISHISFFVFRTLFSHFVSCKYMIPK